MSYAKTSYSQFGEDGILAWIMPPGDPNGHYIDVGCHHPFRFSNTAMLHLERGWSGLNIDADKRAVAAFCEHRPNDINLCMGVAAKAGTMDMAIFAEGAVNTFAAESEIAAAYAGWDHHRETVPVAPLGQILKEHWPKDWSAYFLNVDAEGLDYDVLSSNDWRACKPYCVAVEDDGLLLRNVSASATFGLLSSLGYRLMSHAAITSIYALIA